MRKVTWIATAVFVAGCATTPKINPVSVPMLAEDRQKVEIPPSCEVAYNNAVPRVAVLDFANNTTFDLAALNEYQGHGRATTNTVGGSIWGVGATPAGVGVGEIDARHTTTDFKERSQSISRSIDAKLGESVAEAVASSLVEMGGMQMFTRRQLKQIMEEQKFQMAGVSDPKTAVRLGRLAGARYIITGAINNASVKYLPPSGVEGMAAAIVDAVVSGWHVDVELVVNVIDVQTGEVLLAKNSKGRKILGNSPNFNYDSMIAGIKLAATNAIEDIRPDISRYFPLRGYIVQQRTLPDKSARYALINLGLRQKVTAGQEFHVLTFQDIEDPLTGKHSCDQSRLPVTLTISNQIQQDKAWGVIKADDEGDTGVLMSIKLGQVVERKAAKGSSMLKVLF